MSAYIVSDDQVILIAAVSIKTCYGSPLNVARFYDLVRERAQDLLNENYKSVNSRYNENNTELLSKSSMTDKNIDKLLSEFIDKPLQIIKHCQNLDYQSCEHDGYISSDAKKVIDSVINSMIGNLPGYDSLKWGM